MQKIIQKGKPALFVKDATRVMDYLPEETIVEFKNLGGGAREFHFKNGEVYTIETSSKTKGVYVGDICAICGMGEVVDAGGCATCSRCNAQLKCGL